MADLNYKVNLDVSGYLAGAQQAKTATADMQSSFENAVGGLNETAGEAPESLNNLTNSLEDTTEKTGTAGVAFGGLKDAIGQVSPQAGNAMNSLSGLATGGITPVTAAIGLAVVALKKVIEYIREATEAAILQEEGLVRLQTVLANTGQAVDMAELNKFNEQLQSATGLADDLAVSIQNIAAGQGIDTAQLESFTLLTKNLAETYGITEEMAARSLAGLITEGELGMLGRYNKGWQGIIDAGGTAQDVLNDMISTTEGVAAEMERTGLYAEAIENTMGDIKEIRGEAYRAAKEELGTEEAIKTALEKRRSLQATITEQNSEDIKQQVGFWGNIKLQMTEFWTTLMYNAQVNNIRMKAYMQVLANIFDTAWDYIAGAGKFALGGVIDYFSDILADLLSGIADAVGYIPKVGDEWAAAIDDAALAMEKAGEGLKTSAKETISALSFEGAFAPLDEANAKIAELDASLQSVAQTESEITLLSQDTSTAGVSGTAESAQTLSERLADAVTQYEAGVITSKQLYAVINDISGEAATQIELARKKGELTAEETEELRENLALQAQIAEGMGSAEGATDAIAESTSDWKQELVNISIGIAGIADEAGLLNETQSEYVTGIANMAGALAKGDYVAAAIAGAGMLVKLADKATKEFDDLKELSEEIQKSENLTTAEKIEQLELVAADLMAMEERVKREGKRKEIAEERKSIEEQILELREKEDEAAEKKIDDRVQEFNNLQEIYKIQAEMTDDEGKRAKAEADILFLQKKKIEYLTKQVANADTQLEKSDYLLALEEARLELYKMQTAELEAQDELTNGLTDSQQALVDSLKQQVELGILNETNIADVSSIISQLSGAGIGGINLAEAVSGFGITGGTAGQSGFNTNIGSVEIYNATEDAMNAVLTGTVSNTL